MSQVPLFSLEHCLVDARDDADAAPVKADMAPANADVALAMAELKSTIGGTLHKAGGNSDELIGSKNWSARIEGESSAQEMAEGRATGGDNMIQPHMGGNIIQPHMGCNNTYIMMTASTWQYQQFSAGDCSGRRIFVYKLPKKFNSYYKDNCPTCCPEVGHAACLWLQNEGLGPKLKSSWAFLRRSTRHRM